MQKTGIAGTKIRPEIYYEESRIEKFSQVIDSHHITWPEDSSSSALFLAFNKIYYK